MYLTILSTYYALTTLTTIGFGDFYPVTEQERIVIAFLFLFGVSIFSYFMGVFLDIINSYSLFNQELDDTDRLNAFFDTLKV